MNEHPTQKTNKNEKNQKGKNKQTATNSFSNQWDK
jgi:hypothetical protein